MYQPEINKVDPKVTSLTSWSTLKESISSPITEKQTLLRINKIIRSKGARAIDSENKCPSSKNLKVG